MNGSVFSRAGWARTAKVAAVTSVAAATLAGCTLNFNPSSIPAPGQTGGGSGFIVHLDFPSVLNLPDKARVVVNGVPSGRLDSVAIKGNTAQVDVKIVDGVRVSSSSTATLQQDTILGDVYVSIKSPADEGTPLKDGGVIPLQQTKAPTQIEDILLDLSNFLGSGSLMQLQDTFSRINNNLPDDPKNLQKLTNTITQTVVDLGKQSDNVDATIASLGSLVQTVQDHDPLLDQLLGPGNEKWLSDGLQITGGAIKLLSRVSNAVAPLTFSEPLLENLTGVVAGVVKPLMFPGWPNMDGRQANLANLQDLLQNKVLPFLQTGAKINLRQIGTNGQVPTSEGADQTVKTLRMIGAVP
jgi:phospholipid/cholesterol/gamma-HCH transport system substrate-binding protein